MAGFKGKKIGVTGIPSDDAFYQTMLKTAGFTASDVTKVNVGFNLVPSILSQQGRRDHRRVSQRRGDPDRAGSRAPSPSCSPPTSSGVPSYAELVVGRELGPAGESTPPTRTR